MGKKLTKKELAFNVLNTYSIDYLISNIKQVSLILQHELGVSRRHAKRVIVSYLEFKTNNEYDRCNIPLPVDTDSIKEWLVINDNMYSFVCKNGGTFYLSVDAVDDIFTSYSKLGKNWSSIKVQDEFNLTPRQWNALRKSLKLTKASPIFSPYTLENIPRNSIDKYTADRLDKMWTNNEIKSAIRSEYNNKIIHRYKSRLKELESANLQKRLLSDNIVELVESIGPTYSIPTIITNKVSTIPHSLVVSPFDLHFGKYAWELSTGVSYSRKTIKKELRKATEHILSYVSNYNIEQVIIPIGNDYFHIDNYNYTTTEGTPQDVDGSIYQIIAEGSMLMVEFIDAFRTLGVDIVIPYVQGNHDRVLGYGLLMYLYAWYNNTDDVFVSLDSDPFQYESYGSNLFGFCHGDNTKKSNLSKIMAVDKPNEWGNAKYRYWFTGHFHEEETVEDYGVKIFQVPSMSGTDRWHRRKGYFGTCRSLVAYMFSSNGGLVAPFYYNL